MDSRLVSPGSWLTALTLLVFASSAAAQEVSPRCEAALDRAAGDYSQCLLRADAQYVRDENTRRLERRRARCDGRFERRTTRVTGRHESGECPTPDLVAAIGVRTVDYAAGVASEAGGTAAPSYLYVQNASGGTLSNTTVTLKGVSKDTIFFTDRPYRNSGKVTTQDFIAPWDEGEDSFGAIPPNADFTCEVGDETVNYTVELLSPILSGGDLSYSVVAVDTVLPEVEISCNTQAYLLIDCCYK